MKEFLYEKIKNLIETIDLIVVERDKNVNIIVDYAEKGNLSEDEYLDFYISYTKNELFEVDYIQMRDKLWAYYDVAIKNNIELGFEDKYNDFLKYVYANNGDTYKAENGVLVGDDMEINTNLDKNALKGYVDKIIEDYKNGLSSK